MSSRDLILPDRALEGMITELLNATRREMRRLRWPGATRAVIQPPGRIPIADRAITTLLNGTLEPGRWLLLGGLYTADTGPTGPHPNNPGNPSVVYTVNMWLHWSDQSQFTTTTQDTWNLTENFTTYNRTGCTIAQVVKVDDSTTTSLKVQPVAPYESAFVTYTYPVVTCGVDYSYLLAVPL